ncbi:ABC transporter permease [Streptomyces sp. KL118A]|uniref:ABC transporter permease n=1 Tax=Streptomyces sp. KL118A TaxID=3045153 RepID=UPI00278BBBBB|nr:ABC transporter permease [Streptomyces sp. KL118A]
MPLRTVAPWVRTRLRAAPAAATAFALLVAVTAFLAALFPRAVESYESDGVRAAVTDAGPARSVIELSAPAPGLDKTQREREDALRPAPLRQRYEKTLRALPEPVRADPRQSTYGAQTVKSPQGTDRWLPHLSPVDPQFTLAAQSGLDTHARLREGRLPGGEGITSDSRRVEAAVTADTARVMRLTVGKDVHLGSELGDTVTVRITGILEPLRPKSAYWSYDPVLRTPAKAVAPGPAPQPELWHAGLLLAPDAAPVLPAVDQNPQRYWRVATDPGGLTARYLPALKSRIASLEKGPLLSELRSFTDRDARVSTDLDKVLTEHAGLRDAVAPVVAVAAYGVGGVAAVVLLMTCALSAVRRHGELALLRSRGGSVGGIVGRLLAETSVVAVPAAALGLLSAVLVVPHARVGPSAVAAAAVCVLACGALPVRAAVTHRRPRAHEGRGDLVTARPSRRRTVAELVLLVLAVGAVATLRRRGTDASGPAGAHGSGGSVDWLVSAAPLLVGGIAALLLVRLYPLPLRLCARPFARRRGVLGFLATASAGRASGAQVSPLLALLLALTTAAFGGSVLAGVQDARDRTALLAVGADARVTRDGAPLPASLADAVGRTPGVREVAAVHIDWNLSLPDGSTVPLIAADPATYARLTAGTDLGPLTAPALTAPRAGASAALPAVASPGLARKLGKKPHTFRTPSGTFTAQVTDTRTTTPALPTQGAFLLVDRKALPTAEDTALLVTGAGVTRQALVDAGAEGGARRGLDVDVRSAERAALADSPLQSGAEHVYLAAVAAGAGYAALAVLLALLQSAPRRTALLARLRTMGLGARQGRLLLALEALPQALLAAGGGALVGWTAVELLADGLDLRRIALNAHGGLSGPGDVTLRADPWSLLLPATGVVALTAGVAFAQAWWTTRRAPAADLRTGDTR